MKKRQQKTATVLVLLATGGLFSPLLQAAEWWEGGAAQNGFSEFAPPAPFSEFSGSGREAREKNWRSGSSFNDEYSVKYQPRQHRNPWKPARSSGWGRHYQGKRPWGNVPDRQPEPVTRMRLHDERFRYWLQQRESAYENQLLMNDPLMNYGRRSWLGIDALALPADAFSGPLLIPAAGYPGWLNSRWPVPGYLPGAYPYYGYGVSPGWQRPWTW